MAYKKRLAQKFYERMFGQRPADNPEDTGDISDEDDPRNFDPPQGVAIFAAWKYVGLFEYPC